MIRLLVLLATVLAIVPVACGGEKVDGHIVGRGDSCGGYTRYEDRRICDKGLVCCGSEGDRAGTCVDDDTTDACRR